METRVLFAILALCISAVSIGVFLYYFLAPKENVGLRNLMGRDGSLGSTSETRQRLRDDATGEQFERVKKVTKLKATKKKETVTLEEKFFRAGMYAPADIQEFRKQQIIFPIITVVIGLLLSAKIGGTFIVLGIVFGLLIGLQLPFSMLDRRILHQGDEIMYYLPLVIEQVAIGVSSSLDIGPCLARIVSMADERDSHNAVTELIRHAQFHVKSGVSLEEALLEVGKRSGHTELKHAFMSLSQVAKHGGEITRQLQELADSVAGQRETKIEAKIKKLDLEASAPVALVFAGFLIIILVGFGLQVTKALK